MLTGRKLKQARMQREREATSAGDGVEDGPLRADASPPLAPCGNDWLSFSWQPGVRQKIFLPDCSEVWSAGSLSLTSAWSHRPK